MEKNQTTKTGIDVGDTRKVVNQQKQPTYWIKEYYIG